MASKTCASTTHYKNVTSVGMPAPDHEGTEACIPALPLDHTIALNAVVVPGASASMSCEGGHDLSYDYTIASD